MNLRAIHASTLGVAAIVAALLYCGASYRLGLKQAEADAAQARLDQQVQSERQTNARLEADRQRLQQLEQAASAEAQANAEITPANIRRQGMITLATLKKQRAIMPMMISTVRNRAMPAGNETALELLPNGALAKKFGELFGLSPEKFAALQTALANTQAQVEKTAFAHTTVTRPEPGVVLLEVADTPEFAPLREQVQGNLQQALGPALFDAYETLMDGGVDKIFREQGGGARTIKIARIPGERFAYRADVRVGTFSTYQTGASLAVVLPLLGQFAKLVPGDFQ